MPATVQIEETNGSPGTQTVDPRTLNFGSVDKSDLDPSLNGITARKDGHSYEKYIRMLVSDMGGSSIVDSFKVWLSDKAGDWKAGEGVSTNLTTSGYVQTPYSAPVDTKSAAATKGMPESEPEGPNLGINGSLSNQITAAPGYSDYAVFQLDVSELTPPGSVSQKVLTFQYDER